MTYHFSWSCISTEGWAVRASNLLELIVAESFHDHVRRSYSITNVIGPLIHLLLMETWSLDVSLLKRMGALLLEGQMFLNSLRLRSHMSQLL